MFGNISPKKVTGILKLMGIKPEDLLRNLTAIVKERIALMEQSVGSKLTVLVAVDDETNDLVFCFYKYGQNNELELWKKFTLNNLFSNDTADNSLKSTTYIGSGTADTGNNTDAGHYDGTDSGRNDD